jgi:peptide/nickel transport system substrate-binding protein
MPDQTQQPQQEGLGALWQGRPTRRDLLLKTAAVGIGLGAAPLIASCSSTTSPSPTTVLPTSPKRGGTATLAMQAFDPKSFLDPALSNTDFDLMSDGMLYDNLLKLDNGFQPHASLASAWEGSPNASVWTFQLRKGVEFHDGSPFTAEDVAYSFLRILSPKSLSPGRSLLVSVLAPSGIKILGKYQISFTLTSPYAFFPTLVGGYNYRIVKNGETNFSHPVGTGPFKFVAYTPGQLFVAKRNSNYWRNGLPYLDEVHVEGIPEEATAVEAVVSGNADIADSIDVPTARTLAKNSSVHLYTLPAASFNVMAFSAHYSPFSDIRVRQAIKYATDREAMFEAVLQGEGLIGSDIPIAPDDPLYPPNFKPLPYDPDRAKSLLKAAGFGNGLPITLYTSTAEANMVQTATAFKSVVAAANINVTIQQTPSSSYFSTIWMAKPAFSSFWLRDYPDVIIVDACETNSTENESDFTNTTFDNLVNAARRTIDVATQRRLYAEAMPLLADESGWVIPYWANRIWPAGNSLRGVQLSFQDNADWTAAYIGT